MAISKGSVDNHLHFQKSIIEYEDYVLHQIKSKYELDGDRDVNYPSENIIDRIIKDDTDEFINKNDYHQQFDRVHNSTSQFSYIWSDSIIRNH